MLPQPPSEIHPYHTLLRFYQLSCLTPYSVSSNVYVCLRNFPRLRGLHQIMHPLTKSGFNFSICTFLVPHHHVGKETSKMDHTTIYSREDENNMLNSLAHSFSVLRERCMWFLGQLNVTLIYNYVLGLTFR